MVAGIDSRREDDGVACINIPGTKLNDQIQGETAVRAQQVVALGAGEIVLNCMNNDGVKKGYDIEQLKAVKAAFRCQ